MTDGNIFLTQNRLAAQFLSKYQSSSIDPIYTGVRRLFIVVHLILFTSLPFYLTAQNQVEEQDPGIESKAFTRAVNLYHDTFHNHEKILTGKYYNDTYKGVKGHPYYNDIIWKTASIVYEKELYDNVDIKYDTYTDQLLVKHVDLLGYIRPILLYRAKVRTFQIYDHQFINVKGDSLQDNISGFYDLLLSGDKASVLAKRRKEINQSTTLTSLEQRFIINDMLYIYLGQQFYEVKNRKSIPEILSDKKSELKSFLKLNKREFKNDREKELVAAVRYYNSIVNNTGL